MSHYGTMADAKSVPNPLSTAAPNKPNEKKVVFVNSPVPPPRSKPCLETLRETDLDDLCAFRTIRTVNIQDRRLGLLNLGTRNFRADLLTCCAQSCFFRIAQHSSS